MKTDWFVLWKEDKESILETMRRNLSADLESGYDPNGNSVLKQLAEIAVYEADIDLTIRKFQDMKESEIQHWCRYDMIRRGAVA